jgi:predicted nucleic acid-binding protein
VTAVPFVDANILLRHILDDHADHSPRASAYIEQIERGEIRVRTADTVVFETVFTREKHYRQPRTTIRDAILPLLDLAGVILPGKNWFHYAFNLWVHHQAFSFADCYHAAVMRRFGLKELVSFDRALDRLPDATRIEPPRLA